MSSMWEVWGSGDQWYGYRWVTDKPEYEGPFETKQEAINWANGFIPYFD